MYKGLFMSGGIYRALAWMAGKGVGDLALRLEFKYMGTKARRGHFRNTKIMKKCRRALFV